MKRLELLDYGRFFAASMVMLFHYTFTAMVEGRTSSITHIPFLIEFTKYGYLGVELFFMISGYVIFYSAKNRSASQFAVSRAVRLYPSYWFAVIFTSTIALFSAGNLISVYPSKIIINLTMFQSYFGIEHIDSVYWTLVYEVMFYTSVFVLLLCGLQKKLDSIFIFWPVLMCVAPLLNLHRLPYLGGYFYYFAAGSLFAILKERREKKVILSLMICFVLCVISSSKQAEPLTARWGADYSEYVIALIVTAFFVFFYIQNTKKAQQISLPASKTLGVLTYPVYLIHAHFGYMFISKFATEDNKIIIYIITIALVLIIAFAMHKFIEERYSSFWKKLFTITLGNLVDAMQSIPKRVLLAYNKSIYTFTSRQRTRP